MYKWRDFYLMKVYDSKGKYMGVIEDVIIDFYKGIIKGFRISSAALFKKHKFASVESIISIDNVMKVKSFTKCEGLEFKAFKYTDIIDKKGRLIGVVEDLLIEKDSLNIKALVMSSGIFDKMFKGKEIITLKNCTLNSDNILYTGNESIRLKTLPHNLGGIRDVEKA